MHPEKDSDTGEKKELSMKMNTQDDSKHRLHI